MTNSVSVIIPCYNYGNSIKKAVRSVLAQTHPQLEIIVVNDGSTDPLTLQALEDLKTENIRILHQENKGPSAARNAGAAVAKGDLLMFLDHDDAIHPRTLELLSEVLQYYPGYDYVYSSVYYHGQISEYFVWKPQEYNAYDLVWANHPTLSSLIKRQAHEKVNGFSENLIFGMEDWEYWIKLSKHGCTGKMIDLPLYYYWKHGRTHTATAAENSLFTFEAIMANNPDVYNPVYLGEMKKKWRPIVTIIAYDNGMPASFLSSFQEQTIPDKQIIIVTSDPDRLGKSATFCKEGVTILDCTQQSLAECFNQAFLDTRGEFVFLLQDAGFIHANSVEDAIWRKIFDKNTAWHYYVANKKEVGQPLTILPRQVHHVSGALMETSLLKFTGGFAEGLSFNHSFQDLLLRLEAANLPGLYINIDNMVTTAAKQLAPIEAFEKYPQLFGYSPSLHELQKRPLEKSQKNEQGYQPISHSLKQQFHSEFGAPWYAGDAKHRINLPSLINPASSIKNVLYCIPFMPRGGAEKVDLDVLAALKRDGYRVILVTDTVSEHSWKPKFTLLADEIFHLETITESKQQRVKLLEYLLISRNVSLLFIRSSFAGYELAASLNKSIKRFIATVDLLHAYDPDHEDWIDISTPYDCYIDERIVISQDLKRYMVSNYKISKHKIRVILNGLDTILYTGQVGHNRLKERLQLGDEIKIIGFVGRLCIEKGLFKWLEVATRLNETVSALHFVVVGDGPLKAEMEEMARRLGVTNISFVGWQENVHKVVVDFDVMLMTSKAEGLPVVIMEALCSGIPVVAPDIGGIREILNSDFSGLLASDAPPLVYAQKIQELLEMEEPYKETLRAEAIQFVRQTFDTQVCQQKYIDTLNRLVVSRHSEEKTKAILLYLIAEPFIAEDLKALPSKSSIYEFKNLADYYLSYQYETQKLEQVVPQDELIHYSQASSIIYTNNDEVIADWYYEQYEILPLWFKRLGHVVKIVYGKRSWRTIYDDAAKGYDSNISVQHWYDNEYEVLPLWFKRIGGVIRRIKKLRSSVVPARIGTS